MDHKFNYFYANENEQYLFLQMPLMLIKDSTFKRLSDSAKILYSLLLNRTSLSTKNGWLDDEGRVYIIYTIDEIMNDLNCWKEKANKAMKELKEIGLVKSIRQGLNKPNIIYVMNFATEYKYQVKEEQKEPETAENTWKFENRTSGISKIELQDGLKTETSKVRKSNASKINLKKINPNKNNLNKIDLIENVSQKNQEKQKNFTPVVEPSSSSQCQTDENEVFDNIETTVTPTIDIDVDFDFINSYEADISDSLDKPEHISSPEHTNSVNTYKTPEYDFNICKKIIQDNIEYERYLKDFNGNSNPDIQLIDELINCMLDVIFSQGNNVKIGSELKDRNLVVNHYLNISSFDIDLVIAKYKKQAHKITHLNNYLKTMLYNVKNENAHFYTNAVRVDNPYLFI